MPRGLSARRKAEARKIDNANQLTNIWNYMVFSGSTTTVSWYQYGYDSAGDRQWLKRAHQGGVGDVYRYNSADQLTNVLYNASTPDGTPSGWDRDVGKAFDGAGNRELTRTEGKQDQDVEP